MTSQPQPPYVPGGNQPQHRYDDHGQYDHRQSPYWPSTPGSHPTPDPLPTPPPPAPRRRRNPAVVALLATAAVLAVLGVGFVAVYFAGPPIWYKVGPDTGVQACKALAQAGAAAKTGETGDPKPMVGDGDAVFTEAEYQELRGTFEHSRDEELQRHGTAFVDAMWQVLNIKPGQEMAALGYLGTITSSYAGLTGACGKHGHTLPPISS